MPVTLPFFYKKEIKTGFEEKDSPPRRSKALWIVVAIIFNIFLAASAIIISDRLKKREYIPPEEVPAVVEIPCKNPIDVALVIDRSESMHEGGGDPPQPITDARNAAKTFVEAINVTSDPEKTDRVAIISFNEQATLDVSLSADVETINSAIDSISTNGGTNTGAAIQIATQELTNNGRTIASKAIILLSDGVTHQRSDGTTCQPVWPTSHTECTQDAINQAKTTKEAGITVYTIGLNFDWIAENHPGAELVAEDSLKQMASGEENYFASPESSDLENIYRAIAERVCELSLISGSVFNDWDQDGMWDTEEPALTGWKLILTGEGQPQTTIVDEEGNYAFTNLLPGSYGLSITAQEGWIQTLAPLPTVNLAEGQSIENMNFAFYNPNETHLTCQEEACLVTVGSGVDECVIDSDCFVPPPTPTHWVCSGTGCIETPGTGTDECSADADCTIGAAPTHKTCINNRCLVISGEGPDTCSTDSDCAYEAPRAHKICRDRQCLEVPGEGDNECVSNNDCQSVIQPTGGVDAPAASPSAVPTTVWINPTLTILFISLLLVILGIAI